MGMYEVIILATTSRLLMLLLQGVSNLLIPDHTASMSDVSLSGDRRTHPYPIDVIFRGLSSWDGEHYLLISEEGYKYETNLAFFPLYPLLIRALSHTVLSPLQYIGLGMHSITLIAGATANIVAFPIASYHLYKLTALRYPRDPVLSQLAVVLFTINPANIFMSAVYTECLFSLFSFACIHCLFKGKSGRASLYLALACGTRSNGIALCIFVAMHHLQGIVTELKLSTIIQRLSLCTSQILLGLSPFICYQIYTAHKLAYSYTGIFPYSFIQQKHWGVGVMSYYQLRQLPNFLLAAPVLAISCSAVWQEAEEIRQLIRMKRKAWIRIIQGSFLVIHLCFLLLVGVLVMHIQVMTRFIFSSSPLLYWYSARKIQECIDKDANTDLRSLLAAIAGLFRRVSSSRIPERSRIAAKCIIAYSLGYTIAGLILFPNFYPWT